MIGILAIIGAVVVAGLTLFGWGCCKLASDADDAIGTGFGATTGDVAIDRIIRAIDCVYDELSRYENLLLDADEINEALDIGHCRRTLTRFRDKAVSL